MTRVVICLAAMLLCACGAGVPAELHQTIAANPGSTVRIRLDLGMGMDRDQSRIVVSSHQKAEVRVDASAEGGYGGATRFAASRQGDDVLIEGEVTGELSWLFGGPILRVGVVVPEGQEIEVSSTAGRIELTSFAGPSTVRATAGSLQMRHGSGDVDLELERGDVVATDHEGRLRVRTARGDVEIARVVGAVEATSGRGDIEVALVSGDVAALTERGDIEIEGAGGSVHARTGRGSIDVRDAEDRVEARTARGSIEVRFAGEPAGVLTTDRGSIEVQVPRGAGANLDARTARGDVRLDDGLELTGRRERDFARGSLGGGGDRLVLTTGRGDIELARQ